MSDESAAFAALQAAEYGQYVANQDIYYGSALAYRAGHPVPASNVELHGYAANGLVDEVAPPAEVEPAEVPPAKPASAPNLTKPASEKKD